MTTRMNRKTRMPRKHQAPSTGSSHESHFFWLAGATLGLLAAILPLSVARADVLGGHARVEIADAGESASDEAACREYAKNPTQIANSLAIQAKCFPMYERFCKANEASHPGVKRTCDFVLGRMAARELEVYEVNSLNANGILCPAAPLLQGSAYAHSDASRVARETADQKMADLSNLRLSRKRAEENNLEFGAYVAKERAEIDALRDTAATEARKARENLSTSQFASQRCVPQASVTPSKSEGEVIDLDTDQDRAEAEEANRAAAAKSAKAAKHAAEDFDP